MLTTHFLICVKVMTDPFVGTLTFARVYSGVVEAGTNGNCEPATPPTLHPVHPQNHLQHNASDPSSIPNPPQTPVFNSVKQKNERIGRMLQMNANDRTEIKSARAGDIVALCGLKDTTTGETLCFKDDAVILEKVRGPVDARAWSGFDEDKISK